MHTAPAADLGPKQLSWLRAAIATFREAEENVISADRHRRQVFADTLASGRWAPGSAYARLDGSPPSLQGEIRRASPPKPWRRRET